MPTISVIFRYVYERTEPIFIDVDLNETLTEILDRTISSQNKRKYPMCKLYVYPKDSSMTLTGIYPVKEIILSTITSFNFDRNDYCLEFGY